MNFNFSFRFFFRVLLVHRLILFSGGGHTVVVIFYVFVPYQLVFSAFSHCIITTLIIVLDSPISTS